MRQPTARRCMVCSAVTLLLLANASVALADSPKALVDELEQSVEARAWGPAAALLDAEAARTIASDEKQLQRATTLIAGATLAWVQDEPADKTPLLLQEAQAVHDALWPHALAWLESDAGTGLERHTMSLFVLTTSIVRRFRGQPYAVQLERAAVAHHDWYTRHVEDRRQAPDGIRVLILAAADPKADGVKLLDRAAGWAVDLGALQPGGLAHREVLAEIRQAQAERCLERKQRAPAARYAAELTEHLLAIARAKNLSNESVDAYHDAVRWASREGLVKGPEILFHEARVNPRFASVLRPKGTAWKYKYGEDGHLWTMTRTVRGSPFVLISAHYYWWSVLYTSPHGDFAGDNLNGLLAQDEGSDASDFRGSPRWKRNLRKPLNRQHRKADGYEVTGVMDDGQSLRLRRWYVKDPSRKATVCILVTVLGWDDDARPREATELDAEVEAIIESITIVPRDE